ncbi:MAG: 23S rRNA (guanosine(2251)-2'-O)-methyltransferase RlmB, partial [Rikenellaceae bacterium]|nr:23S rRNA (guanosine(2251)-2'-O)-methyltransferase RlmB [Rikenellaceae bacterium]
MDNIVFGIRPVIEAIESGRQIEKVYVRKGAEGQLLSELKSVCKAQKVHMQEVPTEKLNRMTKLNHQGVVATVSPIVYADVEEILSSVPEGEPGLIVLLDSITDVRNFGAIARSAECVGAHGLITSLKSSAPVNAEAIKSSAGALNIIP